MKTSPLIVLLLVAAAVGAVPAFSAAPAESPVDPYNVVWDTPSRDASGSMPLGNGEVGLNVWVEKGGDLLFYVARGVWPVLSAAGVQRQRAVAAVAAVRFLRAVPGPATEGAEKALVADLAPKELLGTAYGWFNLTTGLLLLPASFLFGWLWQGISAEAAFGFSASCAVLAALLLKFWVAPQAPANSVS